MHGPDLQITIATSPVTAKRGGSRTEASLAGEIRLVKPALLYADVVTLYSPAANLIGSVSHLATLKTTDKLALLRQVAPVVAPDAGQALHEAWARYERLKRKQGKSRDEILTLRRFEREFPQELDRLWEEMMVPPVLAMLEDSGTNDLARAVDAGLLRIESLIEEGEDSSTDSMVEDFVVKLGEVLSSGGTYPLFDDEVGKLVRHGINEGLFQPSPLASNRGTQVAAAAQFMGYLPAFESASIEEVLDVREELRVPLVRFRAAMVALGKTIETAAYEADFVDRVDELYREEIAPALQEIDERVHENAYLRRLVGELIPELKSIVGGALVVGTVAAADLPTLIAGAAATPAARSAIAAGIAAEEKRRKEANMISQHTLYFLYQTQQILKK
jgi:hypothetical protein